MTKIGYFCSLEDSKIPLFHNFNELGILESEILNFKFAQVAELVDALVSGTSVRKDVQVRVLFWVQQNLKIP